MTERDWTCWLRILDTNSGEIFFDCEHCGGGDEWNWFASSSVNTFHSSTQDELFGSASWVWRERSRVAEVTGYLADEFLAWYRGDPED